MRFKNLDKLYVRVDTCEIINKETQRVKNNKLMNNVSILYRSNVKTDLTLAESVYIHKLKTQMNAQSEFCPVTLSLF